MDRQREAMFSVWDTVRNKYGMKERTPSQFRERKFKYPESQCVDTVARTWTSPTVWQQELGRM